MRYLYLTVVLAFAAIGAAVLESAYTQPKTILSTIQESGLGPYLVAGPLIGFLIVLTAPGSMRRFVQLYGRRPSVAVFGFLTMFGFGLALLMTVSAILAIAGRMEWGENAEAARIGLLLSAATATILFACIVAVPEELVFRGFIVSYLRWSNSAAVTTGAVIASAVVYAVAHNLKNPLDWLTAAELPLFVGLFALGVLLAVVYLVTRSLWCPIGLHAALVTFDLAILKEKVFAPDLSPWWLGGTGDIREAPLLWLAFAVASIAVIASRRWLRHHLAIETPYVGVLTMPNEGTSAISETKIFHVSTSPHSPIR